MRPGVRRVLKIVWVLLGIVFVYLVAAALWAYAVTPTVIARASKPPLINLRSLPDSTVEILLRVEDPAFRKHKGLDPFTPGQGRVTLTRALARTLYLYRYDLGGVAGVGQQLFRFVDKFTGPANLAPDAMALVLNARVSKDRQLRLFLQHVYMGNRNGQPVYGFADAARAYFGKRVGELTRRYVIVLVAMMVDPNQFHPTLHPDALGERVLRIERLLRRQCKPRGVRDAYYADCAAARR
jgi:membrane carboxypeptidase/penicillin-binding protein